MDLRKGHSFKARIDHKANAKKGRDCPICTHLTIVPGLNDLATENPELAAEWDYEENSPLTPNDVHIHMSKKAFWVCEKGHKWAASIASRNSGFGCPFCAGEKPWAGETDMATTNPEMVLLFDEEKNGQKPSEIMAGSNRPYWWRCEKGHSWKAQAKDILSGKRCPFCAGVKVLAGFNDLATTDPKVAEEWDYQANGDLSPQRVSRGSTRKVGWICSKGHHWIATIYSRTAGNGCPTCTKDSQVSLPEKAVFFYLRGAFSDALENQILPEMDGHEIDVYVPSKKVAIEYDGKRWHKDVEKDKRKDALCRKNGIQLFRIRENGCPTYESDCVFIGCPETRNRLSVIQPAIQELLNRIGADPSIVNIDRDLLEIAAQVQSFEVKNSLTEKYPWLLRYWDYEKNAPITPDKVYSKSNKLYWWIDANGVSVRRCPNQMTRLSPKKAYLSRKK